MHIFLLFQNVRERRVCNLLINTSNTFSLLRPCINYILLMIWIIHKVYLPSNHSKSSYWQFNLQDNILPMFIFMKLRSSKWFVAYDTNNIFLMYLKLELCDETWVSMLNGASVLNPDSGRNGILIQFVTVILPNYNIFYIWQWHSLQGC